MENSFPFLMDLQSVASSNKCLTSSNKKLLGTSASLLVTSALLVVTKAFALLLPKAPRLGLPSRRCNQSTACDVPKPVQCSSCSSRNPPLEAVGCTGYEKLFHVVIQCSMHPIIDIVTRGSWHRY